MVVVKSWSDVYWILMPLLFSKSASEALKFFSSSPPKAPRIVTTLSPSAVPPSMKPPAPPPPAAATAGGVGVLQTAGQHQGCRGDHPACHAVPVWEIRSWSLLVVELCVDPHQINVTTVT